MNPNILAFFLGFSLLMIACGPTDPTTAEADVVASSGPNSSLDRLAVGVHIVGNSLSLHATDTHVLSGVVISDQTAQPSSKTGGVLRSVTFSEGQDVRRGQLLARIETTEFDAAYAQAEAGVEKARRDLNRVEALFADSVATRSQRDDAATALKVADKELARIQYNRAQSDITAPISGRVLRKLKNTGETVGPGMPVAVIQGTSADDWRISVGLTDQQWAAIELDQQVWVQFDAFPGTRYAARVSERPTAADPATGTFPIKVELLRQPPSLAAGLLATVKVPGAESSSDKAKVSTWQTIPLAALGKVAGKRAEVFVMHHGRASSREIVLGNIRGEKVEALSGLQAGDTLITTGVAWLRDGDQVELIK
jgi:RND family efflux transporter MFP subunit